ncbi:glycoside hydrolase family 16 protein [Derxia lacustris]|uniref:glycoside hydrolase family 16 protein n=1 Tax=Derxia lacustris TaxID=764842 RepID=UPI001593A3DE|nr:glycoside hydrolase family 16 protein [Derxia lacustris]
MPSFRPRTAALAALLLVLAACSKEAKRPAPLPYTIVDVPTPDLSAPAPADIPDTLDLPAADRAMADPPDRPADKPVVCQINTRANTTGHARLKLSFVDRFDRLQLDDQHWAPHFDGGHDPVTHRWFGYDGLVKRSLPNGEEQVYVDAGFRGTGAIPLKLDPFSIKDGVLGITADRTPPELRSLLGNAHFTSGLLSSHKFFSQRFGYFELRARMPAGKALWPAFWLLPTDRRWPPELDVFEVAGQKVDLIKFNLNWIDSKGWAHSPCQTHVPDAASAFHLYGVLWTADVVTWYIDRQPIASAPTPESMRTPMYLLINLAVGSHGSVGKSDASTPAPATLLIDHVAAWALDDTH